MKAGVVYTATGPIAILTSHSSLDHPALIEKLGAKGIDTFLAWEVPVALAQERYGSHFSVVVGDVQEGDDLRILDEDGRRVFKRFPLAELGQPLVHQGSA
jgi:hypothetical protein